MSDVGGDPPCWAHLVEGGIEPGERSCERVVVDLGQVSGRGSGAVWSLPHGGDLDANLVRLEPGGGIGAHVNNDVEVLMFVQSGTGLLIIGDERIDLASDHLALIPKGERRAVTAGPAGITYLSVHRRRSPLGIANPRKDDE